MPCGYCPPPRLRTAHALEYMSVYSRTQPTPTPASSFPVLRLFALTKLGPTPVRQTTAVVRTGRANRRRPKQNTTNQAAYRSSPARRVDARMDDLQGAVWFSRRGISEPIYTRTPAVACALTKTDLHTPT